MLSAMQSEEEWSKSFFVCIKESKKEKEKEKGLLNLMQNMEGMRMVPPLFNIPKTMLQCYGEAVYSINKDMLSQCANGKSSIDRFISVVAWNISTLRPLMFGVAPYNPILGETHHVSRGPLNVLLEQVVFVNPISFHFYLFSYLLYRNGGW
ncbi:hypothetical protein U1Q18_026632 [Sarracenia purpurea var. burkii]